MNKALYKQGFIKTKSTIIDIVIVKMVVYTKLM